MRGNANENSTRRVWRNDGPICTCSTCSVESNRDSEWMSVSEYPNNCVKQRPSYKANLVIRLFRFQKAGSSIIEKKECLSWSKLIADSRRWVSKSSWKVGPKWFVSWLSLLQQDCSTHRAIGSNPTERTTDFVRSCISSSPFSRRGGEDLVLKCSERTNWFSSTWGLRMSTSAWNCAKPKSRPHLSLFHL